MTRHLFTFLAVLLALLAGAAQARAQKCDEIRAMPWGEARKHIYNVHAQNGPTSSGVPWSSMLPLDPKGEIVVGNHIQPGMRWANDGQYTFVQPNFPNRLSLHFAWNHLVQHHKWGNWEKAEALIIQRLDDFDSELIGALPTDSIVVGPHVVRSGTIMFSSALKDRYILELKGKIKGTKMDVVEFDGDARTAVGQLLRDRGAWEIFEEVGPEKYPLASNATTKQPNFETYPIQAALWVKSTACQDGVKIYPVDVDSPVFMKELAKATWLDYHSSMPLKLLEPGDPGDLHAAVLSCWKYRWEKGTCWNAKKRFYEIYQYAPETQRLFVCQAHKAASFLRRYSSPGSFASSLARDILTYGASIDISDEYVTKYKWWRPEDGVAWTKLLEAYAVGTDFDNAVRDLCEFGNARPYAVMLGEMVKSMKSKL